MALPPGWKPLIVCDGVATKCDFNAFITLIKNGVHDLVLFSTLAVVALLCYAGFLWLTSQGDVGKHKQAIGMLKNIIWGYVWILAAWLIVYTIANALLKDDFLFLIKQ